LSIGDAGELENLFERQLIKGTKPTSRPFSVARRCGKGTAAGQWSGHLRAGI